MQSNFLLFLFPVLISFSNSPFHQDTPLKVDEGHNIIGLPDQFENPVFDLSKGYLKIGKNEVVLPACIEQYFHIHKKPKVSLSASWYHPKEIMPYYLHFNISQDNNDYSYSILVDLESLEIIKISISIRQKDHSFYHEIQVPAYCIEDYNNSVTVIK